GVLAGSPALVQAAQIQNPLKAAKDAYNKAKQQQQQQQPNHTQSPPLPQPQAAAAASSSAVPSGDCCSPDVMKKTAASLTFLDILGVKVGMTPEQAFAAIKASDPKLKIDIVQARVEPGDAPQTFKRFPQFALAHTVGPPQRGFNLADGS